MEEGAKKKGKRANADISALDGSPKVRSFVATGILPSQQPVASILFDCYDGPKIRTVTAFLIILRQ
jgi:hypothetical protein